MAKKSCDGYFRKCLVHRQTAGGATLEYATVLPVILFVIVIIFWSSVTLYEYAVLQTTVNQLAYVAEHSWKMSFAKSGSEEISLGAQAESFEGVYRAVSDEQSGGEEKTDFMASQENDLYWQLRSIIGASDNNVSYLRTLLLSKLIQRRLISEGGSSGETYSKAFSMDVSSSLGFPFTIIGIEVSKPLAEPLGGLISRLGLGEEFRLRAKAVAIVMEESNNINDVDLFTQVLSSIRPKDVYSRWIKPLQGWFLETSEN